MRTSLAALICCLLVASLAGATAAGAPSTADPGIDGAETPLSSSSQNAAGADAGVWAATTLNNTLQSDGENQSRPETIEIEIDAEGDAHFVLAKEFPAESDAERRAFQRLADEYERGQHGDLGFSAYEAAFQTVAEASSRDMELLEDGRYASRDDDVGRLEYRFTWTNFAQLEDGTVTIGDAFAVDDDVWMELYEGQHLIVRAPDGYGVAASPSGPEIEDDTLIWTGPASFTSGDLDVTFDESTDGSSSFPATLLLGLAIAFLLVGLLAAGWWAVDRRSEGEPIVDGSIQDALQEALPSWEFDADTPSLDADAESGSVTESEAASAEAGAVNDVEPSAAPEPSGSAGETVNPELLSDEERVEHLLEENGGRMKQANIVAETGWSNAKVSQLLSRMAEEDRVDKLRIGRENLITLPEVDVTDQDETES